jgi:hypothetical protein
MSLLLSSQNPAYDTVVLVFHRDADHRGRNLWQTLLAGGGEVGGFLGASEPAY